MLPNPEAVFTDQDGIATDTLSLRLIEDPDSVVVTAKGTTLLTNHVVTKTVNLGPVDPEAIIEVDPPIGQRVGYPFQLDGSNSTFDPQVDLTCFEWDILYGIPIFDVTEDGCVPCQNPDPFNNPNPLCTTGCVDRGSNRSVVTLSLGDPGNELLDQNLSITLRVSDDPTIVCQNDLPVDDRSKFSPFLDTETYLIRCDLTDPLVEAGGDRFESLSAQGGTVSLTLTATSSDPEDIPPLDHRWDCGNGIVQDPLIDGVGETFTCVYVTTGTFTATVEVENDCGRSVQDSLIVQINP
jgi:hypothetical protein